jgi:hypothetical protein
MSPLLLPLVLLASHAALARPLAGVAWVPFSRGDLAWIEDDRSSGTGVGEFDGLLVPSLTFYGGATSGKNTFTGGLAIARITTTDTTADTETQNHVGALRLSADWRRSFGTPAPRKVNPWLEAGLHGIIPSARDVSDAYSDAEQSAADEGATAERQAIGGAGLELGPGFTWAFDGGLSVGARYHLVLYASWSSTETTATWTTFVYPEAALLLEAVF